MVTRFWIAFNSILQVVVLISIASSEPVDDNVVCYYISSNGYKRAPPEILDPNLCTHVIYTFAHVYENGTLGYSDFQLDIKTQMYKRFVALKERNTNLKVLLSVMVTSSFSKIAANETKRRNFATSASEFLEKYGFDGIDLDWERPYSKDRANLIKLLKDIKRAFIQTNFLISMAVYPNYSEAYDAPEISRLVDLINVMTYNFFGGWSKRSGQQSGLYASSKDSGYERQYLNVDAAIQSWINAGAQRQKLMMGIPFYGRSFTLEDPQEHDIHAPVVGAGERSVPTYWQIQTLYQNWTSVWDDEQKNYYRYIDNQWVGYEEERSVREKVSYAVSQRLGGVMIWHLGADDVRGEVGPKQSLLRVINDALGKLSPSDQSTTPDLPSSTE